MEKIIEKVKAFFANKITKAVAWTVLILAIIALIIGGVAAADIATIPAKIAAILSLIAALIAFITERTK